MEHLITRLKKLEGAIPYDGNYSVQVAFKLANGKILRIGESDHEDGEEDIGIWCDQFEGLNGELLK
jgi:hypothetical protein